MSPLPSKLIAAAVGLAFVLAASAPADATQARKHRKQASAQITKVDDGKYRGTNLFPAGPIYNGPDYIGDDPDPNIRFQLNRDLGTRYGGEN